LDNFKDHMESAIQAIEKDIRSRTLAEWKEIEEKFLLNQHNRNRNIVKEVIETSKDFRDSIQDNFERMRDELDEN
jgi:protein involved in sex pheromone biosynthesis